MHQLRLLLIALFALTTASTARAELLDQDIKRLASDETVNLADVYAGKVVLIVNTASKCGNTPQYDGLEKLYQTYGEQGLVVLGFPSNNFAGQEPGTEAEIQEFCRLTYGVKFPMFEKMEVKGDDAHPLYQGLADAAGTYPTWNFHKYLIGRDGKFLKTFSPGTKPEDQSIVSAIESALSAAS
ncbi:MAG: glutathione peroxidase [Pseudomonadota bacterium]